MQRPCDPKHASPHRRRTMDLFCVVRRWPPAAKATRLVCVGVCLLLAWLLFLAVQPYVRKCMCASEDARMCRRHVCGTLCACVRDCFDVRGLIASVAAPTPATPERLHSEPYSVKREVRGHTKATQYQPKGIGATLATEANLLSHCTVKIPASSQVSSARVRRQTDGPKNARHEIQGSRAIVLGNAKGLLTIPRVRWQRVRVTKLVNVKTSPGAYKNAPPPYRPAPNQRSTIMF